MINGSFVYQIDKKGRVVVPPPMRKVAGAHFFLCRLPEKRAALVPAAVYRRLLRSDQREYWQMGSVEVQADATTGRIQVPCQIRRYLDLGPYQEVVWTGVDYALTLQSKGAWDQAQVRRDEQMQRYLASICV